MHSAVGRLIVALALSGLSTTAFAAPALDLTKPTDALVAYRKMQCSTVDNKAVVYRWTGSAYSRVPGEPDRLLFKLEGMNIRSCATVVDPERGTGFRQVSREIMLYLDPKTGAVLRKWDNPWSGETVDVVHVANDPVNMRAPVFPKDKDGKPFEFGGRVEGGVLFQAVEVPLFYENALGGKYQDYVGGKYHAMEIFDFTANAAHVLDRKSTQSDAAVAWVRIADWLPWMKMRGRAGEMVFNCTGLMLQTFADLPQVMRDEIAANYPAYTSPPPAGDARPNETSWTYFGKKLPADK
jgi:hypothetical protein